MEKQIFFKPGLKYLHCHASRLEKMLVTLYNDKDAIVTFNQASLKKIGLLGKYISVIFSVCLWKLSFTIRIIKSITDCNYPTEAWVEIDWKLKYKYEQ